MATVFGMLTEYFNGRPDFRLVLVYGSAAKGNFRATSDVDIAVANDGAIDRELLCGTAAELSVLLGREVDMIDLYRAEGLILYRVMVEGRRIRTDGSLFVKYKAKALGYREDFKPLQDMMRNARIWRFVHGS